MKAEVVFSNIVFLMSTLCMSAQGIPQEYFTNSHDIRSLDCWGPYSKQYAGISHIEDPESGRRVDFSVIPGFYRRSYMIPNVLFESGVYPWKVSPDMNKICYRYELEWKDRVYVDVTYDIVDAGRVSLSMHCVNNTSMVQDILLHNTVSLHYDENYPKVRLEGLSDGVLVKACDYSSFEPAVRGHDYNLVYDGWLRGEERDGKSVSGSVLGKFGRYVGDRIEYVITVPETIENACIAFRCKTENGRSAELQLSGLLNKTISICGTGDYELYVFDCGTVPAGDGRLVLNSSDGRNVKIDAIIMAAADEFADIRFENKELPYRPLVKKFPKDFSVKYKDVKNTYAIAWNYDYGEIKEFANSDLDVFMRKAVHKHPTKYFAGDGNGHYVSAFLRPVILKPMSDTTIVCLLVCGDEDEVRKSVAAFHEKNTASFPIADKVTSENSGYLPGAKAYAFVNQLLQATLLTNVVYPVYTQKEYIRHFTPGKNWNSLYTWDSGCIALALNEIDCVKAFETIRAYTTEQGAQSAFIHHGTPLPIQFFAFSELDNKLTDKAAVKWLYPRLKQYYAYMTGRDGTATTMLPSGLMKTWDYFYNSGGWDDYPPQQAIRGNLEIYANTTPVVTTAYYLRAARIMRMFAEKHGYKKDVDDYSRDIRRFSEAIQNCSWDDESGYYSYVIHDRDGNAVDFYRYEDGSNYNMGMDGVTPLVAGCSTEEQAERLIGNIFSPEKMWTDYGISTVDRSAAYYDYTGYWNGSVWIPHQYFIWKALLDYGRPELAERLAMTALSTWNRECMENYNCTEHIMIASGRSAGWHNFSGLSSPLINLYDAYFKIGHIATGFDTSVEKYSFSEDFSSLKAVLRFDKYSVSDTKTIIVCMNPAFDYEFIYGGKVIEPVSPYRGLYYIPLKTSAKAQKLTVSAK